MNMFCLSRAAICTWQSQHFAGISFGRLLHMAFFVSTAIMVIEAETVTATSIAQHDRGRFRALSRRHETNNNNKVYGDELDELIRFRPNTIEHRTSEHDRFMDPCKAPGFLTDIALGDDDLAHMNAPLLRLVERKPFSNGYETKKSTLLSYFNKRVVTRRRRACPVSGPFSIIEHCLRQQKLRQKELNNNAGSDDAEQPEEDELMIVDPDVPLDFALDKSDGLEPVQNRGSETTGNISAAADPLIDVLDQRLHNLRDLVSSSATVAPNNNIGNDNFSSPYASRKSDVTHNPSQPPEELLAHLQTTIVDSQTYKKSGNITKSIHVLLEQSNNNNNINETSTHKERDDQVGANFNAFSSSPPSLTYNDDVDDLPQSVLLRSGESDNEDYHYHRGRSSSSSRTKRAATAKRERLWDFGVIPYVIGENTTHERRAVYVAAMRHWMNLTCITFVERRPQQTSSSTVKSNDGDDSDQHRNYIFFTERPCGCCSFVGRRGNGGQAISIGKNCDKFGIVVHELGHVVGFWHEHTRPDRDKHVDILYKNVMSGQEYNFAKLNGSEVDSLGQPYDHASIMHYARNTFSKSTYLDTLLPRVFVPGSASERPEIGQRLHLSSGDIVQTNLLYKCPKCGRTLLEPYDTFHAPQYEASNSVAFSAASNKIDPDENRHCVWKIFATPGEIISLNISDLDISENSQRIHGVIESGENCKTSYLEVRDGYWHLSPLLGRFCGSSNLVRLAAALTLKSSGPFLYVEYRQQQSASSALRAYYRGFHASYEFVCGGNISTAAHGTLQSPNFPDLYRPDKECVWIITVKVGYQVALRFHSFEIENHDQCIYDRLELRDGPSSASPLISRLCGYERPDVILKSTGNVMYVKFVSDGSVQKSGFSAEYVTEFDECAASNLHSSGCEHKCVNTFGGYRCECHIGYELHSDGKHCEEACGGYIDIMNSNGTLSSPSFPNLYPASKKCIWQISAPENYRVILNFTHFDMEGNNEDCEYDYVLISSAAAAASTNHSTSTASGIGGGGMVVDDQEDNNGVGSDSADSGRAWKSHGAFCGQSLPPVITSENNIIRITFNSDASVQKTGFGLIYFSDFDECSNNNGGCQQLCTNTIGSFRCSCESGYDLHIDMRSCKEGGCTHNITAPVGEIKSPAYPDPYPSRKDCTWAFSTRPGHRIGLSFYKFEIEPHQECLYDYVEIFDGLSGEPGTPMLGRFCGTQAPPPITSSTNHMFMTFKSDASVQREGFHGVHRSVCGGHYYANDEDQQDDLFIYSHAAYGDTNYGNNEDCDWLIEVSPSTFENDDENQLQQQNEQFFVYVEFDAFEVEDDPECTYDFVDVYDGYSAKNAPKIGRFCSNVLPPAPIVSTGRALLVKFKSDASINAKGFKFRYGLSRVDGGGTGRYNNFDYGGRGAFTTSNSPYYYSRRPTTAAPRFPDGWIDDNARLGQQQHSRYSKPEFSRTTPLENIQVPTLGPRWPRPTSRKKQFEDDDDDGFDTSNFAVELPPLDENPTSSTTEFSATKPARDRKNGILLPYNLPYPISSSNNNATLSSQELSGTELLRNFRRHDLRRHDEEAFRYYETSHSSPNQKPTLFEEKHSVYSSWSPPTLTSATTETTRQNYEETMRVLRQRYSQNYNSSLNTANLFSTRRRAMSRNSGITEPTRFWFPTTSRSEELTTTTTSSPFLWHSRQRSRSISLPSSAVSIAATPTPTTRSAPAPPVFAESVNQSNRFMPKSMMLRNASSTSRSGSKFPITGRYYASPPQN